MSFRFPPLSYAPRHPRREISLPGATRRYILRSHRASLALHGLREVAWQAALAALFVGEAAPDAILAELAQLLGDLAARWQGQTREQAMATEMKRQADRSGA